MSKAIIGRSISIGGLLVAVAIFVHASIYTPEADYKSALEAIVDGSASAPLHTGTAAEAAAATPKAPTNPAYPSRLLIPAIDVNAHVQYHGLSYSGNIGIPTNFKDVSWYSGSTVPGNMGAAVIDGHVDNALALPGVFKHLHELAPGDDVYVQRNNGQTLHFKVTAVTSYPYESAPIDTILSSSDGKAHLNLITCVGEWDQVNKTYNERLVVYTTLVGKS